MSFFNLQYTLQVYRTSGNRHRAMGVRAVSNSRKPSGARRVRLSDLKINT
jgi:hypothetical protein